MNKMSLEKQKDMLLGVLVICLGIYVLVQAAQYPAPPTRDLGAAMLPQIIGIGFLICGGTVLFGALRTKSETDATEENKESLNILKFLGIVVLNIVYVLGLPKVGYWVSTLLYLIVLLWIVSPGSKNIKGLANILFMSLAATTVIYLVFGIILKVPLP